MERISFGTTGLDVSRIVFGTWVSGGWAWGGSDQNEAQRAILRGLELGINFIDTAPVYGFGQAETLVGRALRQWGQRDSVVVATKCGLEWDERRTRIRRNSSPDRIRWEVDQSLGRLGVDRIDLYQLHWPDARTPFAATMEALRELQDAGKIHHIGLSNFQVEQIDACRAAGPVAGVQPPFNLFERAAASELLPYCRDQGLATLVYGGLCRGLLSGKFTGEERFAKGDLRRGDPKFKPDKFKQYLKAVAALRKIADRYQRSMAQFALRWALQQPGVTCVIAGARTAAQVEDNAGLSGWQIESEDLHRVEEILARHIKTPVGPEFLAPPE